MEKSSEWCEEIRPSNASGVYSYKGDVEGEKFFLIRGELKNLAGITLDIDNVSKSELTINGKYKMPVYMDMEESDGTSFYGNAKLLQTLNLIVYASVSDELYELCKNMELKMNIVNNEEKLDSYYDEAYPQDSFVMTFSK